MIQIEEALKELLEAVEDAIQTGDWKVDVACDPDSVIRRSKEALAQPEQEPVAWLSTDSIGERHLCFDKPLDNDPVQPLYTTPPQRKPLTDEELADLWYKQSLDWMEFARAIEAAHGIKENI